MIEPNVSDLKSTLWAIIRYQLCNVQKPCNEQGLFDITEQALVNKFIQTVKQQCISIYL